MVRAKEGIAANCQICLRASGSQHVRIDLGNVTCCGGSPPAAKGMSKSGHVADAERREGIVLWW